MQLQVFCIPSDLQMSDNEGWQLLQIIRETDVIVTVC